MVPCWPKTFYDTVKAVMKRRYAKTVSLPTAFRFSVAPKSYLRLLAPDPREGITLKRWEQNPFSLLDVSKG